MDRQGNTYTILYSIVLVVVVAALLAIVSLSLQPLQNEKILSNTSKSNTSSTPVANRRKGMLSPSTSPGNTASLLTNANCPYSWQKWTVPRNISFRYTARGFGVLFGAISLWTKTRTRCTVHFSTMPAKLRVWELKSPPSISPTLSKASRFSTMHNWLGFS